MAMWARYGSLAATIAKSYWLRAGSKFFCDWSWLLHPHSQSTQSLEFTNSSHSTPVFVRGLRSKEKIKKTNSTGLKLVRLSGQNLFAHVLYLLLALSLGQRLCMKFSDSSAIFLTTLHSHLDLSGSYIFLTWMMKACMPWTNNQLIQLLIN